MLGKQFKKIRIVGGSGSGKSYLAKRLGKLTKIPVTHLDEYNYDFSKNDRFDDKNKRSKEDFLKLCRKAEAKKSWIIDGGYFGRTKKSLDDADIIIYLRPLTIVRLYNIWRRYFKRLFKGQNEGFLNVLSLTRYFFSSIYKWDVKRYKQIKLDYSHKAFFFRSADKAYEWFKKNYNQK